MRKAAAVFALLLSSYVGSTSSGTTGLDATFGIGGVLRFGATPVSGIALTRIRALRVQGDGKMLIAGYVWGPSDPQPMAAIGRLMADGQWDVTFADHGLFVLPNGAAAAPYGGRIDVLDVFSNGDILGAGSSYQFGGHFNSCVVLVKLTSTGVPDTGFGPDMSGSYCFDFAPPPAGSYLVSHFEDIKIDSDDTFFLTTVWTNLLHGAVARLDATGALVNTYGSVGIAGLPSINTGWLELLPGHQVLAAGIVGSPTTEGIGVSSIDSSGSVDLSYGTNGVGSLDVRESTYYGPFYTARDAQGRLLVSSYSSTYSDFSPYRLARFVDTGAGDPLFNAEGHQAGSPGIAVLSLAPAVSIYDAILGALPTQDGHIIVVGSIGFLTAGDGVQDIALIRLNDDSSFDESFGQAAHPGWTSINLGGLETSYTGPAALTTDPASGRFLVAFSALDANGAPCGGILRIVPDRLLDASFDSAVPVPNCPQ